MHKVLEYIVATVVYITISDSDDMLAKDSPEYAQWLKAMERFPPGHKQRKALQRQLDVADSTSRHYLGKTIKIDRHLLDPKQEGKGGTHASPRTHWRTGHFRPVWKGPRNEAYRQNVWIKPTIVNAGKGPVHTKQRVVK